MKLILIVIFITFVEMSKMSLIRVENEEWARRSKKINKQ
jgi:hypothetical protein